MTFLPGGHRTRLSVLCVVACLAFCQPRTGAQYLVTDFHPEGYSESFAAKNGDGQQAGYAICSEDGFSHACIWFGAASSLVDLNPAGFFVSSWLFAVGGGQQAGGAVIDGAYHAALWSGTAASFVDLHPEGATGSEALGMGGGQQVGYAVVGGRNHAALWSGTADSFVDLNPPGSEESALYAVSGAQQAGIARLGGNLHAALWAGTPDSVVDLHPAGAIQSFIYRIDGGQQVGNANYGGAWHAGIWSGTAASFVDLHPAWAWQSMVNDGAGGCQVGSVYVGGNRHAALWSGTADSFVDLHAFLPADFIGSQASGIDAAGNIVGYGQLADGSYHALLWTKLLANREPIGIDDAYSVRHGHALNVAAPGVLGNDSDPDGDALVVTVNTIPAHGTAGVNADGSLTYSPSDDYVGADSFTYTISDGQGGSATAQVTIAVTNSEPVAQDDVYTVTHGRTLTVAASGVLTNDSDPDGDALSITGNAVPAHGTVTVNADGSFAYTPSCGYVGVDSFAYTVADGVTTATATVVVTVVNDPPIAVDDGMVLGVNGWAGMDVLLNDSDPDGDMLTVVYVTQPANGTAWVFPDGWLAYAPAPDWNGVDTFSYRVSDGLGGTASATARFVVVAQAPALSAMSPATANSGATGLAITVTGANFARGSTVLWNGVPRTTTFVSSTRLTATVPASDLASARTVAVSVQTPAPGGGTSNALPFVVQPASAPRVSVVGNIVLVRDGRTGYINATVRLVNTGTGAAGNVVVHQARLNASDPIMLGMPLVVGSLPAGGYRDLSFTYPPFGSGSMGVYTIQGGYGQASFGGTYRVRIP